MFPLIDVIVTSSCSSAELKEGPMVSSSPTAHPLVDYTSIVESPAWANAVRRVQVVSGATP